MIKQVVIWGTGFSGKRIYEQIKSEYNVIAFTDNNQEIWGEKEQKIPIVSPNEVYHLCGEQAIDGIVIGTSSVHYADVQSQIREQLPEFDMIFEYDYMNSCLKKCGYGGNKPILPYIEFDATRKCNLNCRACSHFSNLIGENITYSLTQLENDMSRLAELFFNINYIHIVGGEPFLCKDLGTMIKIIREKFPKSNVEIVSNGLLIPTIDRGLLQVIKANNVRVLITMYEPTKRIISKIENTLNQYDVQWDAFGFDRDEFIKYLGTKGDSNPKESIDKCLFNKCTTLIPGHIAMCSASAFVGELNRVYGTEFPEENGIDIYEAKSGEQILDYLKRPVKLCAFCTNAQKTEWGHGKGNAQLSDWIVDEI